MGDTQIKVWHDGGPFGTAYAPETHASAPKRGRPEVLGLPCPRCEGGTQVCSTGRGGVQILDWRDQSRGIMYRKQGLAAVQLPLAMLRRRKCKECEWQGITVEYWLPDSPGIESFDEDRQWQQAMRRRKTSRRSPDRWKPRNYIQMFIAVVTRGRSIG